MGLCWDYVVITLGLRVDYFGTIVGTTLELLWNEFGISFGCTLGLLQRLCWDYFRTTPRLLWDYVGTTLGLLGDYRGTTTPPTVLGLL